MEKNEKEWDVCPNYPKNFICKLVKNGNWREEGTHTKNKWLFHITMKEDNPVPTFGDQRNFFTGLFEAEWKNDNYIFKGGHSRNPQRQKKIKMFQKILEEIEERTKEEKGISFYINKWGKNNELSNSKPC